ncbi:MAG: ORF6N domain-containing protein, partial [Treponema sp.]|nr:ORF6N domain-containing protein [Treponema sp.]
MANSLSRIQKMIYDIRGHQVMLDADLAKIYQVETKRLNEAVKRNLSRFLPEFMFQLTEEEYESLRSQFATSKSGRGGRRYLPFAFTEHGVIMLSSVLNSEIATKINIAVVKAFIEMRRYALSKSDTN